MPILNHAEIVAIHRGMAIAYESDALRAGLRASALAAAGSDDAAGIEHDEARRLEKMAKRIGEALDAAIETAKKDGYTIVIAPDGTVMCRPPAADGDPFNPPE